MVGNSLLGMRGVNPYSGTKNAQVGGMGEVNPYPLNQMGTMYQNPAPVGRHKPSLSMTRDPVWRNYYDAFMNENRDQMSSQFSMPFSHLSTMGGIYPLLRQWAMQNQGAIDSANLPPGVYTTQGQAPSAAPTATPQTGMPGMTQAPQMRGKSLLGRR